jgi:hypothetical protein
VEEAWLSVGSVRGTAGKYRLISPSLKARVSSSVLLSA